MSEASRRQPWPTCDSVGPRIGNEGQPHCRRPAAHPGFHRPSPDDGWGDTVWDDMLGEARWWRERLFPVALR